MSLRLRSCKLLPVFIAVLVVPVILHAQTTTRSGSLQQQTVDLDLTQPWQDSAIWVAAGPKCPHRG
jgi:hypothetical protein